MTGRAWQEPPPRMPAVGWSGEETPKKEIGRAHAEFFRDIRPATTLVGITRLVDPDMLVEIEVDVVIGQPQA